MSMAILAIGPDNFFGDRMDDLVAMAEAAMRRQGVNGVNEA